MICWALAKLTTSVEEEVEIHIDASGKQPDGKSEVTHPIIKRSLQIGFNIIIQAVILFILSGRLDWMMAWGYIGVNVAIPVVNMVILIQRRPDFKGLIAERTRTREDVKGWDRTIIEIGALPFFAILITAGLDARLGWSPQLALTIQLLALVLLVLGNCLVSWAMLSNKFFARGVSIQKDRGHTVITTGAYQFVRHPGYAGMILYSLATPLMLSSLWALIPAWLTVCVIIARTALEDRTLQDELDGYREYAKRVRYRLLPSVW